MSNKRLPVAALIPPTPEEPDVQITMPRDVAQLLRDLLALVQIRGVGARVWTIAGALDEVGIIHRGRANPFAGSLTVKDGAA